MAWVKRGLLAGLVVLALIPLALLVMTAMHIRPVYTWIAGNNERIITVYVPVNHTVYVNRTVVKYVYVNQTVPVYINRTVYVPVYVNPLDTGTCNIYTLVLTNGSLWTLGYWIPTQQAWNTIMNNITFTWYVFNSPYGELLTNISNTYVIVLGERGIGIIMFDPSILTPWSTPPDWTNIFYFGGTDRPTGNVAVFLFGSRFVNNSVVLATPIFSPWSPYLPLNTTSSVLLITPTYYIILCNWTVIGPVDPQVALRLPAPMGVLLNDETWYLMYGNYDAPAWGITWGSWVWLTEVQPINVSNLPWPLQ